MTTLPLATSGIETFWSVMEVVVPWRSPPPT